jgi:hypothetical protein
MLKKIDVSYDKDLRQPEWKMLSNKMEDGLLIMEHLDSLTNNKFKSKTRFAGYEDGKGKPVILYQEIWGEE